MYRMLEISRPCRGIDLFSNVHVQSGVGGFNNRESRPLVTDKLGEFEE